MPMQLGMEASGTVDALGTGVEDLAVGDRIAYAMQQGSYAEYSILPAWKAVPIPEGVSFRQAAAVMLQGMTAHYLSHSTYELEPGDTALVHAAAGGVGLLLVQMAKLRGARVIATAGSPAKAELARNAGADEVILYNEQDFAAEALRLNDGRKLDVIYDSVGRTTFEKGLDILRPRGYMVLFGQSSGAVAPLDPQILNAKGSLFLTRPTLAHYTQTRNELLERAGDIFNWIAHGKLHVRIDRVVPLARAGEAHTALESRATTGKVLLEP
jgi:NADPH2:quinone reductase